METRQKRRTMAPLINNIRAADGQDKRIEGYFSTFDGVYEIWPGATESVDPHAFDDCLQDDVRCLIDHDTRLVLGRTTAGTLRIGVDEKGLWFSVDINPEDTDAMNLYSRVKRGDVSGCSFGFDILEETTDKREDGSIHWTIKKVKLYEGSVCTFPAYQDTSAEARRHDYKAIRRREVEKWKAEMKERMDKWH